MIPISVLKLYTPTDFRRNEPTVTLTTTEFKFNVAASRIANFNDNVRWLYVFLDEETREIVFAEAKGDTKPTAAYKLGRERDRPEFRSVILKKMINETPWLYSVARLQTDWRKFDMYRYEGNLPKIPDDETGRKMQNGAAWGIKVSPSFELKISPDNINELSDSVKGIYRYIDENGEVLYIGSGFIRSRFQDEQVRKEWGVSMIEYSPLVESEKLFEWESYWQLKHREKHGSLPPLNRVLAPKS